MAGLPSVHPSAEVEPDVVIGPGTTIWRYTHVRRGAVIGRDCTIAAGVFVDAGVRIGDRVKIQNNVSVYAGVEIGDEVLVGPSAVFTNDRYPRAVGDWEQVPTRVGAGATIGANATVVCGNDVGAGALVAAGAVVTRDVQPNELVGGNPARRLGWVCACGRVLAHTDGPRPSVWRCRHCGRSSPEPAPRIELHSVDLGADSERLVLQVLRSGQLAEGPMVARFEQEWAGEIGVRHAVAVSSGTSALLLALRAAGIGPGDEVVTSPLTFAATLSTILEAGATARFADVDEHGCMAPAALERVLSERTRAILPVHLYGMPADMPSLASIAAAHGIVVIEDVAQAAGARVAGRAAGSYGTGCFSFYATKNLPTGEGGMITTDDDGIAAQVRSLRNHGRSGEGRHERVGHNYRMSDLHAAVGVAQRKTLRERNDRRRAHAAILTEGLKDLPGLRTPDEPEGRRPVYSLYTVRVTRDARLTRDELARHLAGQGVESGVYYPTLVFEQGAFRNHPGVVTDPVPHAATMPAEVLSLPAHPNLTTADAHRIVEAVRRALI